VEDDMSYGTGAISAPAAPESIQDTAARLVAEIRELDERISVLECDLPKCVQARAERRESLRALCASVCWDNFPTTGK
jgi:hypothetical protein